MDSIGDAVPTRGGATSVIAEALRALERRLSAEFPNRLERMILFGSHARGTARADSDVDVFVLISNLTPRERARVYELGADVYLDTRVRLAPLAMCRAEYQELLDLERALALDIEREGIPV